MQLSLASDGTKESDGVRQAFVTGTARACAYSRTETGAATLLELAQREIRLEMARRTLPTLTPMSTPLEPVLLLDVTTGTATASTVRAGATCEHRRTKHDVLHRRSVEPRVARELAPTQLTANARNTPTTGAEPSAGAGQLVKRSLHASAQRRQLALERNTRRTCVSTAEADAMYSTTGAGADHHKTMRNSRRWRDVSSGSWCGDLRMHWSSAACCKGGVTSVG